MTELDQYFTPKWVTEELLLVIPSIASSKTFEPCAGLGGISKVISASHTNDLDKSFDTNTHEDATNRLAWERFPTCDWVVTNPPYANDAGFKILRHAYAHAKLGVAFLMRLSFLEPTQHRQEWLYNNPPDLMIVLPRVRFIGKTPDFVTSAWFVWYKTIILGPRGIKVSNR